MSGSANANQADLNTLLRWATENTPQPAAASSQNTAVAPHPSSGAPPKVPAPTRPDGSLPPLGLTFNPASGSDMSVDRPQSDSEGQRGKLDTGILDAIMGRTDAIRIREAMAVFEDESKGLAEREVAGEELEELVQDLDNANDLEPLGIWPRLVPLLSSSHDRVRYHAAWIVGTAVQNNPKSQAAFFRREPLLTVLDVISRPSSSASQSKALYLLSSALKHAPPAALEAFESLGGWPVLAECLKGPSLEVRRKTAFLLGSLALQEEARAEHGKKEGRLLEVLQDSGVLETLVQSLSPSRALPTGHDGDAPSQDEDYADKALRALVALLLLPGARSSLSANSKRLVSDLVKELQGPSSGEDGVGSRTWEQRLEGTGMGTKEWEAAQSALQ